MASDSKIPEVVIASPSSQALPSSKGEGEQRNADDEAKDYEEFLAKAKKDEENAARKKAREIREARERNMSPWAGRM